MSDSYVVKPQSAFVLPGTKVLLMGYAGTGKTHSIGTLVEAGIHVYYLDLEQGLEALLGFWRDKGKPVPANLSWRVVEKRKSGLAALKKSAHDVGSLSFKALSAQIGMNKDKENPFELILDHLANFVDQRTGTVVGDLSELGPDSAIVIDGQSGLCQAAMRMCAGNSMLKDMKEYGLAQANFMALTREIVSWPAHVIMIAHVSREVDPNASGVKLFPKTGIGTALNGELNQEYSDVILAERRGDKFSWATASDSADTKTRNLPLRNDLAPDFGQIVARWKKRQEV